MQSINDSDVTSGIGGENTGDDALEGMIIVVIYKKNLLCLRSDFKRDRIFLQGSRLLMSPSNLMANPTTK
jgi:hypothetical protein